MLLFGMASLLVRAKPGAVHGLPTLLPTNWGWRNSLLTRPIQLVPLVMWAVPLPKQAASAAVPMGFLGPSLIFMLTYVWSRNFPTTNVSLMGLVCA